MLSIQRKWPIVTDHSAEYLLVCGSVCPVDCGKTPEWIRITFGMVGRMGPGMRQVVEFGDWSTGTDNFWRKYEAPHCNQWGTFYYWEFPLCRGEVAAWSFPRTAGAWAARAGLLACLLYTSDAADE